MSRCNGWRCEREAVARGWCLMHYKQYRRGLDPAAPAPQVGDPADHGRYGILDVSDDGEYARCHVCGEWHAAVGSHSVQVHGLDVRDYRIRYGLPRTMSLLAPAVRARKSEEARARIGSAAWRRFEEARDPQAAADARDLSIPSAPSVAAARAERITAAAPRMQPSERRCVVCEGPVQGRALACSDECRLLLRQVNRRRQQAAADVPLTEHDEEVLRAATEHGRLREVIADMYRRGVRSARIAAALGRSPGWMSQHYPRSIIADQPLDSGGELPPLGELRVSDDGGEVQCHRCGRWFRSLSMHARQAHDMSADDYRQRHAIPKSVPLVAPALSITHSRGSTGKLGTVQWERFLQARQELAQQEKPMRRCVVCGTEYEAHRRVRTCSRACRDVLITQVQRANAASAPVPMTAEDRAALTATDVGELRDVIVGLYRRGVRTREIAQVLGWTQNRVRRIAPPSLAETKESPPTRDG